MIPALIQSDIEAEIASEHYFTVGQAIRALASYHVPRVSSLPQGSPCDTVSVCVMVTHSGFVVTGESHCLDRDRYDADLACAYARKKAIEKLFEHMAFHRKQQFPPEGAQPGERA